MKKQKNISEQIYNIISDTTFTDINKISNDKSFEVDLNLDSLDCINIIMQCEKTFNIHIPDYEVEFIITVNDLIETVKGKNPTVITQKQNRIHKFFSKFQKNKQAIVNVNSIAYTK